MFLAIFFIFDVRHTLFGAVYIGFGLSAFFFFGLALVENGTEAVVFLTIAVGLGGIAIAGTFFLFLY